MKALPILASKGVNKNAGRLYVSRQYQADQNCNRSTEINTRCLPESLAAVGTSEEVNLAQVVGKDMVPENLANSHIV